MSRNTRNSGIGKSVKQGSPTSNKSVNNEIATVRPNTRIGVVQMTSTSDRAHNLAVATKLCLLAKASGVGLLCFPECFSYIGPDLLNQGEIFAESKTLKAYADLAVKYGLWLSLGGFPEKHPQKNKVYNTHIVMNSDGTVVAFYRKIHLFSVNIADGPNLDESQKTEAGYEMAVVETPFGTLGLSICYDLRFPELYSQLRLAGANVLLVPSAFTVPTGQAHWETLLRARAIENQCYVIAAAQVGQHNAERTSYGHALAVDPWGKVLSDAYEVTPNVAFIDINLDYVQKVRAQLPKMQHLKFDVYAQEPRVFPNEPTRLVRDESAPLSLEEGDESSDTEELGSPNRSSNSKNKLASNSKLKVDESAREEPKVRPKRGLAKPVGSIGSTQAKVASSRSAKGGTVELSWEYLRGKESGDESDTESFGPDLPLVKPASNLSKTAKINNSNRKKGNAVRNNTNSTSRHVSAKKSSASVKPYTPPLSPSRPKRHPVQEALLPTVYKVPSRPKRKGTNIAETDSGRKKSLRRSY